MDSEYDDAGRGYLLPPGCADLIDALRSRPERGASGTEAEDLAAYDAALEAAFAKKLLAGLPESSATEPMAPMSVQQLAEDLGVKIYRLLHELLALGVAAEPSTVLAPEQVRFLIARIRPGPNRG